MKFAIMLKMDETVQRHELKETMAALLESLNNPEVEFLRFEFVGKEVKGKMKINVMEFPISK